MDIVGEENNEHMNNWKRKDESPMLMSQNFMLPQYWHNILPNEKLKQKYQ